MICGFVAGDAVETDLVPYQTVAQLPARRALVIAPHADDEVFGCGGAGGLPVVGVDLPG